MESTERYPQKIGFMRRSSTPKGITAIPVQNVKQKLFKQSPVQPYQHINYEQVTQYRQIHFSLGSGIRFLLRSLPDTSA